MGVSHPKSKRVEKMDQDIESNSHAYSISREYVSSTQTEDAELTLLYLNHNLEVNNMRDAMMEKYKDCLRFWRHMILPVRKNARKN